MAKKSDKRETTLTATEASRSFSAILDRIGQGERFLVERHGRVACLMSAPPAAGRKLSECVALLRSKTPVLLDDRFGKDLLEVIACEPRDERPWES